MDFDSLGRRNFLQQLGSVGLLMAAGKTPLRAADSSSIRWPSLSGSPVLDSLHPVIEHSRDVQTHVHQIQQVAAWMAFEELPMPDYSLPLGAGEGKVDET